ncbi:MAG: hypothetical protein ACYC4L_14870 [Chloroflexota bacterium]
MVREESDDSLIDRFVEDLSVQNEEQGWSLLAGSAELTALAWLSKRLFDALRPVEPAPAFRNALHATLVAEARSQQSATPTSWADQHRREILIGAAALGSTLSLAGMVALVRHRRDGSRRAA